MNDRRSFAGLTSERHASLTTYWEQRFPGRGRAIMEFLGPFYADRLSFVPRRALPNLVPLARAAVLWQQVKGVSVITSWLNLDRRLSEGLVDGLTEAYGEVIDSLTFERISSGVEETLSDRLSEGIMWLLSAPESLQGVRQAVREYLVGSTRQTITFGEWLLAYGRAWLRVSVVVALWVLFQPLIYWALRWLLKEVVWRLTQRLFESLTGCLLIGACLHAQGLVCGDIERLLALWCAGNIPAGSDREGHLLVFCA